MERSDFIRFGYTGCCPGCVHSQAGLSGSRTHNEASITRIEECLEKTPEGRARKDRAVQRREEQPTRELERQDVLISPNGVDGTSTAAVASKGGVGEVDEER